MRKPFLLFVLGTTAIHTVSAAQAQQPGDSGRTGGLEEIVVTAQKRAENLQETPIAISAISGDALSNMGATNIADIAEASPSLYSRPYPSSNSTITLYIRGQGTNDPMQMTKDGAVGLYLDGFYLARPQTATVDLADVERVEILRGPQGTLYGRNTTGGAVNVISRGPTGEIGLRQQWTFGNRGYVRSLSNIDLPALGNLAAKITVLASNKDGFVSNPRGNDFNEEEQLAARAALRWTPADALQVDYSFEIGRVDNTPIYYQNRENVGDIPGYTISRRRAYRGFDLPKSHTKFNGHALTVEWEASDALTIRSLTGYRHVDFSSFQDYAEAFRAGGAPFFYTTFDEIESRQYSQEIQFIGSAGDQLEYVAGLYYFREKGYHPQIGNTVLPGLGPIRNERFVNALSKSKAAYLQATWTPPVMDERLSLTLGGRYTEDDRKARRSLTSRMTIGPDTEIDLRPPEDNLQNKQQFKRFNPAVTVALKASDDINVYAKYTTGYRSGGTSESGLIFVDTFGPEKVTSYEVGLKSDWFDRRLRVNLAGFLMDYRDMQLDITPRASDLSITQTLNAGKAKLSGFEADVTLALFDSLTISAAYTYLHQKMKKVIAEPGTILDPAVNPDSPFTAGQDLTDLFVVAFAPKHSVSLAADWTILQTGRSTLSAHANWQWKDEAAMTAGAGPATPGAKFFYMPSYDVLDGRVTLAREIAGNKEVRFSIWGKNIMDKKYPAHVIGSGDVLAGYTGQAFAYAEPASYGIEVGLRF